MGSRSTFDRFRDWLGGRAFRLTCWLYQLDPEHTYLDSERWG